MMCVLFAVTETEQQPSGITNQFDKPSNTDKRPIKRGRGRPRKKSSQSKPGTEAGNNTDGSAGKTMVGKASTCPQQSSGAMSTDSKKRCLLPRENEEHGIPVNDVEYLLVPINVQV